MTLWLLLAGMTGIAVMALLWPLARARPESSRGLSDDAAFYRAALADLDRDAARGLIGETEAAAARIEAARRLLRSEGEANIAPAADERALRRRRAASAAALIAIPLMALGFYGFSGSPDLPGQPLAARRAATPASIDVTEAVARIEAHLARNPDDGAGHEAVAPVYLRMGRLDDAARAFAASLRLNGETPHRLAGLGEALVARAGGIVTTEAKERFARAAALDAKHAKARFYLALASEQDGDRAAAIAGFESLLKDSPADAPWSSAVRERLASLRGAPEGGETIAALPEEERRAAIRSMVDNLSQRLATNGGSLDDWSRLVRSRMVLAEKDRAAKALADARAALGAKGATALDALARELGL